MILIINMKFLTSPRGLLYLMLLIISIIGNDCNINIVHHNRRVQCLHKERLALLKLKDELVDDYGRLSTWGNNDEEVGKDDCCRWKGVICDNMTNHIIALDLQGPREKYAPLRGKISASSLAELNDLHYLDLSSNNFNESQIPESIYFLSKLQHLNLSKSHFSGLISHRLGNLSMLGHVDLSGNWDLTVNDLDWLSKLRLLEYLDLSHVNLERATTWLQTISNLKTLKALYLQDCSLSETNSTTGPLSLSSINGSTSSSSLDIIDLSSNNLSFTPTLFKFLNLSSSSNFSYIDFSSNNFDWRILEALGHLMSLSHLDLSFNNLEGDFPQSFMNLISLKYLNLATNNLNGQFSDMVMLLGSSTKLEYLDLSWNELGGPFPNMSRFIFLKELKLKNNKLNGSLMEYNIRLPHLEVLDVSGNRFSEKVPNLASCSSLRMLSLNDNMFNGTLTERNGYLSKLEHLDLGSNQLEGIISEAHLFNLSLLRELNLSLNSNLTVKVSSSWNPPFHLDALLLPYCNLGPYFPKWLQTQKELTILDISNAKIHDTVPDWFWDNFQRLEDLNMSYNQINGVIPELSSAMFNLLSIDLSSNQFSGSLPLLPQSIDWIDLSKNSFSGTLVHFCIANNFWGILDLSDNILSGELPKDCAANSPTLFYLSLANNNFSGQIPNSISPYCGLSLLYLHNNNFEGEIPKSLRYCNQMFVLDLGVNKFTGKIPGWIGKTMTRLDVLSLKSNKFYGRIPLSLCHLTNMHVLDISMNKISGTIPKCVNNFSIMSTKPGPNTKGALGYFASLNLFLFESAQLIWKGKEAMYVNSLGLLSFIDFSSNNLGGEIPPEITSLVGLIGLNLSRNNFVGPIPRDIGKIEFLNFLDLSKNNLSGGIPSTLSQLNQLGALDLSFNNLSGRIPWNNHLQTFTDSAFMGNPGLCGDPLQFKPCPEDLMPKKPMVKDNDEDGDENSDSSYISEGFYICMAIGFITGFCVVLGTIFHNKSCRIMFLKMLTCAGDWLYVKILVNKNRLKRYFQN